MRCPWILYLVSVVILLLPYRLIGNGIPLFGVVQDARTHQPLEGAEILILPDSLGTVSDKKGHFRFPSLTPGARVILVRFIGYQVWKKTVTIPETLDTLNIKVFLKPVAYSQEEVIILGSPHVRHWNEFSGVYDLQAEEIWEEPAALTDPQRALGQIPSVVPVTDQYNELSVRGGAPWENSFYVHDFLIRNPNHFGFQGSSGGAFSFINPFVIRNVRFYSGNFPVEYNHALSGIARYELREAFPARGVINANFAGVDGVLPFVTPNKAFRGFFGGRKSFLNFIGADVGLTHVPEYTDGMAYARMRFSARSTGELLVMGMNDRIQLKNNTKQQGYTQGIPNARARFQQFLVGATFKHIIRESILFNFTAYRSVNRWKFAIAGSANESPYMQNTSREEENTVRLKLEWIPANRIELTAGAEMTTAKVAHFLQWQADRLIISRQPDTRLVRSRKFRETRSTVFAEMAFQQRNKFRFSAGLSLKRSAYFNQYFGLPRLAASLGNSRYGWVHLVLQRNLQWPDYLRMTLVNFNRQPAVPRVDQFSLAYAKQWKSGMVLNIEMYYKRYKNLPYLYRFDTPGYVYAYSYDSLFAATQQGKTYGIEVLVGNSSAQRFRWKVTIFGMRSRLRDWRNQSWYPGNFDVPFGASIGINYRWFFGQYNWYQKLTSKWYLTLITFFLPVGNPLTFSLQFRVAAGRPFTRPVYSSSLHRWVVTADVPFNQSRLPHYRRLDVRLAKQLAFRKSTLTLYFNLANLLNAKNIWEYQYLDNGNIMPLYQFQTLPFLGLVVQF